MYHDNYTQILSYILTLTRTFVDWHVLQHVMGSALGAPEVAYSGEIPQSPITVARSHLRDGYGGSGNSSGTGISHYKSPIVAPMNSEGNLSRLKVLQQGQNVWGSSSRGGSLSSRGHDSFAGNSRDRPVSQSLSELSYDMIDDDIYEDESDGSVEGSEEYYGTDSQGVSRVEYEGYGEDSGEDPVNSSNGSSIFLQLDQYSNAQDDEFTSSLGEDFLCLFAASRSRH